MKLTAKNIGRLFEEKLSHARGETKEELIKAFAELIVVNNKSSKLSEIVRAFSDAYNKRHNEMDVTITTVDKETLHFPGELLGKKVNLKVKEDKSILGGIKIEAENLSVDNTVLTKIRSLKLKAN